MYVVYFANYNHARSQPLEQDAYPFNSLEKAINQINFIFKRPDNPDQGLFNNEGIKLKRSIVTPPYKMEIDDKYKDLIIKVRDPQIYDLIF